MFAPSPTKKSKIPKPQKSNNPKSVAITLYPVAVLGTPVVGRVSSRKN
jgi:hypothetical protein